MLLVNAHSFKEYVQETLIPENNITIYWEERLYRELLSNIDYSFIPVTINTSSERIELNMNNTTSIHTFNCNLPLYIMQPQCPLVHDDEMHRIMLSNDLMYAVVWDKKEAILLQYYFYNTRNCVNSRGDNKLCFKEIYVRNNPGPRYLSSHGKCMILQVSLWGWEAKNSLMLSRSELKPNYGEKVDRIIYDNTKNLLVKIKHKLLEQSSKHYNTLSIYFMFLKYAPEWSTPISCTNLKVRETSSQNESLAA